MLGGLCLLALTVSCSGGGSQAATAEALAASINQTATAAAASEVDAGSALLTAEAEATARSLEAEATQAAQGAQDTASVEATAAAAAPILAELPTYGVDPSAGELRWIHPPVTLEVEGYLQTDSANIYLATVARDFVISADITWNTQTGLTGCGFVLRSDGNEEAFNQYLAIATRGGNGSIAFIKQINGGSFNSQLESLGGRDPAFNAQNDGTNRLTVVARGETFTIFTNGTQVQQFTATEFDRGFVAMVALSESGRTVCEFNNAWLWLIE
jgi:hypothetical protein